VDRVTDPRGEATDWPQWRGPKRTGVSTESGWLTKWPPGGPKILWRAEVGLGYSSLAVSGREAASGSAATHTPLRGWRPRPRVYTMGNRSGTDYVYCLDADSGQEVWKHSYPCRRGGYKGPRATPTVHEGLVYTCSREGLVFCFKAGTGEVVWKNGVPPKIGAKPPGWGVASSPLIEGDMVIVNIGTAGVALDKATGRVVWNTGREKAGFSSAFAFTMDGERRIAIFAARAIVVLDASSGKTVWQYPWRTRYDVNAVTPIVSSGKIFISSGYGVGCALLRIGSDRPVVWRNREMRTHFNSCVLLKGHLYGFDDKTLKCLVGRTGEVKWSKRGFGKGSLMIADEKLIILGDSGVLAIAEATPTGYQELARAKVVSGLCWTVPVLSGGRIYCRSHPRMGIAGAPTPPPKGEGEWFALAEERSWPSAPTSSPAPHARRRGRATRSPRRPTSAASSRTLSSPLSAPKAIACSSCPTSITSPTAIPPSSAWRSSRAN
jgi:outer membrane protein assembly factor BamB